MTKDSCRSQKSRRHNRLRLPRPLVAGLPTMVGVVAMVVAMAAVAMAVPQAATAAMVVMAVAGLAVRTVAALAAT
jgi:hypothetical protein